MAQLLANRADAADIYLALGVKIGRAASHAAPGSPFQPGGQPGDVSPLTSPPTLEILGEKTREQRDAELRLRALSLHSSSSPSTPASSIAPTVRHAKASSPVALITADAIPNSFRTSPSFFIIPQVLSAPMDPTVRDWRAKIFYEAENVAGYERWLHTSGQPHTDMADALKDLNSKTLGVSEAMRDADPDISAEEWDTYRRILIHALYRVFKAGVRWMDALRALSIVYESATHVVILVSSPSSPRL